MTSMMIPPGAKRLKSKCDILLSTYTFKFNLRRYPEAVAGPYVWGRYDLLLLPPSFPYGEAV